MQPLSRTSFFPSFLGLWLRNLLSSELVCNQRLPEEVLWRYRDGLHQPVLLCRRRERLLIHQTYQLSQLQLMADERSALKFQDQDTHRCLSC